MKVFSVNSVIVDGFLIHKDMTININKRIIKKSVSIWSAFMRAAIFEICSKYENENYTFGGFCAGKSHVLK